MIKKTELLLRLVKPFWKYALLNIIFNILSVIFGLFSLTMIIPFLQLLFKPSSDIVIPQVAPKFELNQEVMLDTFYFYMNKIVSTGSKSDALVFICFLIVIMFFFKNLFRYLAMYFIANVRNGVVRNLRNHIYKKIVILPLSFFAKEKKGDIMSRFSSDVQEVEWSLVSSLEMIFRDPIAILFYLLTLFTLSTNLTLFALILLPLAIWLITFIGKSLKRTSIKVQKRIGVLLSVVEESISGLRIIKGFNAIDFSYNKFAELNQGFYKLNNRLYRKRDLASPLSEFLGALILVIIIWYGGKLVLSNTNDFSADMFILFILVFSQIIPPAKALTTAYYNIQKGIASLERINEVINADERITEIENPVNIDNFNNEIVFNNTTLVYDESSLPAINNINLKIKKGQKIAIVGHSGSGKSTLVDLLPRFYDFTSGSLTIDGVDIKNIRIDDLRKLFGIVSQETILFNDTIKSNIAFGMHNFSDEDVIKAAKMANAHDFIMQTTDGYNTIIGDRGVKLSGGERQRLSIARAILKNSPILILDEATSSLDTNSEVLVQKAIDTMLINRTAIVIAHRLSTIINTDLIVVLDSGKIVEIGKHDELIKLKGYYFSLFNAQTIHS